MAQHQAIRRSEGRGLDGLSELISMDAWAAVRILGALAARPADFPEICRHAALAAPKAGALLDVLVRRELVRSTGRDAFALNVPAQALSIADIVRAVDGDVLRRAPREELPEIEELLRRIASATADILDNFSLAEAAEP